MKKSQFCPLAAFTLIELIVTLSIMMLILAGGAVSINNFSSRQKLKNAKSQARSILNQARNYAKTEQNASDAVGNHKPVKCVSVNFAQNKATVKGDTSVPGTYSFINQLVIADNSVTISNSTTPCFATYIGKSVDYLDPNLKPFPGPIYITITVKDVTSTETVIINPSGIINE